MRMAHPCRQPAGRALAVPGAELRQRLRAGDRPQDLCARAGTAPASRPIRRCSGPEARRCSGARRWSLRSSCCSRSASRSARRALSAIVGFVGLAACLACGWAFLRAPDAAAQKRLDTAVRPVGVDLLWFRRLRAASAALDLNVERPRHRRIGRPRRRPRSAARRPRCPRSRALGFDVPPFVAITPEAFTEHGLRAEARGPACGARRGARPGPVRGALVRRARRTAQPIPMPASFSRCSNPGRGN